MKYAMQAEHDPDRIAAVPVDVLNNMQGFWTGQRDEAQEWVDQIPNTEGPDEVKDRLMENWSRTLEKNQSLVDVIETKFVPYSPLVIG